MIEVKELVEFLKNNKLKNISVYNLSSETEERFIILSTTTKVAESKKVATLIAEKYEYCNKIEGFFKGEWIVFDFSQITLHIFLPKVREKYNLDKMYKPKKIILK